MSSPDTFSPSPIEYVPSPSALIQANNHPEFVALNGLPAGEGVPNKQPSKQLRVAAGLAFLAVVLLLICYVTPFIATGKIHDAFGYVPLPTTEYRQGILYYAYRPPYDRVWKYVYINPRSKEAIVSATSNAALHLQGLVPVCFILLALSGVVATLQHRRGGPSPSSLFGYSGKTVLRANTVLLAICCALTAAAMGLGATEARTFCSQQYSQECRPHFGFAFLLIAMASTFASFAITLRELTRVNPAMCD